MVERANFTTSSTTASSTTALALAPCCVADTGPVWAAKDGPRPPRGTFEPCFRVLCPFLSSSSLLHSSGMALTTPGELPLQLHVGSLVDASDQNWSPNWTVTVDNLPGEVLLEIFDHYRQSFDHRKHSLRVWNNKNGWFKLAHVCHKWRCIVLASPSRLRLLLMFAESTPTRAAVLESLSHLPILVDYRKISWNAGAQTRFISALRYPNRVLGISIKGSRRHFDKICQALDLPFPALTNFELHDMPGNVEPILLASSFMTSIKSLKHLRLANVQLSPLLPLLSVTRALVYLNLTIDTLFWQTAGTSFLTHLQLIPHLREIHVSTQSDRANYMRKPPVTTVLLAELSYFHFSGQSIEMEWFVAGLITPSLRGFHISSVEDFPLLHILHLSKFIRVPGINFFATRLSFSGSTLTTTMFAPPHLTNDYTNIVEFRTPSYTYLGRALSPMLATVEDVFLCNSRPRMARWPLFHDLFHWRFFFEELRNVAVLRLHHDLLMEVANMLRQPAGNPSPAQEEADPDATTTTPSGPTMNSSSRNIFILDILPSLEQIVVYERVLVNPIGTDRFVSAFESLKEYAIERQQVGRPVKVLWETNCDLPELYTVPDVDA